MADRIRMGNDELILHIRKHYPSCTVDNRTLGRQIWQWLMANDHLAQKLEDFIVAPWMADVSEDARPPAVTATNLPTGGALFEFDRSILPELFAYLAVLGGEPRARLAYPKR